jgi:hypothetical protein
MSAQTVWAMAITGAGLLLLVVLLSTPILNSWLGFASLAAVILAFVSMILLPQFVGVALVSKPLVDLTWQWRFAAAGQQGVNLQSVVGALAIAVAILAPFVWSRRLVTDARIFGLLAVATVSVVVSPSPQAVNEYLRLLAALSFFFTTGAGLRDEAGFERFAKLFVAVVSVPLVLSIAQWAEILPYYSRDWVDMQEVGRVSGAYEHPLNLLYFLIYAIPVAMYLVVKRSWDGLSRMLPIAFIGISLFVTVLTYHRVALVTLGLQILFWLILSRRRGLAVLVLAAAALTALWFRERLEVLYENAALSFGGEVAWHSDSFLRGRGAHWYVFLTSLFSADPLLWLIGRGGSTAEAFLPGTGFLWVTDEPHSEFVRLLHAYGLLGLGLYLVRYQMRS